MNNLTAEPNPYVPPDTAVTHAPPVTTEKTGALSIIIFGFFGTMLAAATFGLLRGGLFGVIWGGPIGVIFGLYLAGIAGIPVFVVLALAGWRLSRQWALIAATVGGAVTGFSALVVPSGGDGIQIFTDAMVPALFGAVGAWCAAFERCKRLS